MAQNFRTLDFARELDERARAMERDGKLYVVPLDPPLVVQTPAVTLATAAFDGDGEPLAFAHIAPPRDLQAWLRGAEAAVLETSIRNKKDWFRKALDDDAIRASFKSFFRDDDKFKVKVPASVAAFEADCKTPAQPAEVLHAGARVRCVLELSRVCFGRTEFGAQWRLVQVAACAAPVCLIDSMVPPADEPGDDGSDVDFV